IIRAGVRKMAERGAIDAFHAFVKPDNEASLRAFLAAGFADRGQDPSKPWPARHLIWSRDARLAVDSSSGSRSMQIAGRPIGPGHPAYVIAELSANHNQDYAQAVRLIHAAKECGADAVKLQTYTPDTLTIRSQRPEFQIGGGTLWDGRTLYDLY